MGAAIFAFLCFVSFNKFEFCVEPPTNSPSSLPSGMPSFNPSGMPSFNPSGMPSFNPSGNPSANPSAAPSGIPDHATKEYLPFEEGDLEIEPGNRRLQSIVDDVQGILGSSETGHYKEISRMLPTHECENVVQYAEKIFQKVLNDDGETSSIPWKTQTTITEDFRFEVPPPEVEKLMSKESVQRMYKVFEDFAGPTVPKMVIRRTEIGGNKHIRYHKDGDFAVLHGFLNGDDLDGGNLFYLTPEGAVRADASTGTVLMHKDGIVHGVSSFTGVRMILLLIANTSPLNTEL